MRRPSDETLQAFDRTLAALDVQWVVTGAFAANVYRDTPRMTQDVDIYLSVGSEHTTAVSEALQQAGWRVRDHLEGGWLLRVEHPVLGRADLCAAQTDYERQAIARAVPQRTSDGTPYKVLAPEDVIVLKMIANRYQDYADVESILRTGIELDRGYLEEHLEQWGVAEPFHRLESGLRDRDAVRPCLP